MPGPGVLMWKSASAACMIRDEFGKEKLLYSRASHSKPQPRKVLGINESENAGGWMLNPGSVQKK